MNFEKWEANRNDIPTRSQPKIFKILDAINDSMVAHPDHARVYKGLFFAKLFYSYIENKKGDIALNILVDDDLIKSIKVPPYIREGIEWLST